MGMGGSIYLYSQILLHNIIFRRGKLEVFKKLIQKN